MQEDRSPNNQCVFGAGATTVSTAIVRSPLKLCFIVTGLEIGGAELMLLRLLGQLDRNEFSPTLVSLAAEGPLAPRVRQLGVELYALNVPEGRWSLSGLLALISLLKRLKPDVIQGWMYHGNLAAQAAKLIGMLRAPVVWNIRGTHTELKNEQFSTAAAIWLGGPLSYTATMVINNSHVSMDAHIARLRYSESNVVIIPNGFDTEEFQPDVGARLRLRTELRINGGARIVGHVARLHPMKDHVTLIRAAALFLRNRSDVHFVLIGEGVDESSYPARFAEALGIGANVHFLGRQDSISTFLPGFDLVTLTSAYGEGFPNAVGEAMACGVPCVVTNVGDSAYLVGPTGEVVQPKDVAGLARKWGDLLDLPAHALAERGRQARSRVLDQFSVHAIVSRYEDLYRELASRQAEARH